ncbi:MAG: hypothetical protein AAGN82_28580, partial [Myxococcota bacterium]
RVLMAGDATFDAAQTDRRGVSGISEDLALARMTQERLRSLPPHTLLLPSHDQGVFARFAETGRPPARTEMTP